MEHILVLPMHDPKGLIFPHMQRITPALKALFSQAVISIKPEAEATPAWISTDPFYRSMTVPANTPIGKHFSALYTYAAETCDPQSVLHLCFPDRLSFQMECGWSEVFLGDIRALSIDRLPLIFQRSTAAWDTHPSNYRAVEGTINTLGELVCGKLLDFAWCHLALTAAQLRQVMLTVHRADMSMMAEIVVQLHVWLHADIQTKYVDWLAWEDPFIFGVPDAELKRERETSLKETHKRMAYALPMMDVLYEAAAKG